MIDIPVFVNTLKFEHTEVIVVSRNFVIFFQVFNLGDYRREEDGKYSNHEFFNPDNKEGRELRERVCQRGLDDVLHWLQHENGEVAVFDATNTTRARRKYLYDKVVIEKGFKLFFIESLCNDDKIIDTNIKEVKVTSPDYTSYRYYFYCKV